MTKNITLLAIIAVGIVGLAGCSTQTNSTQKTHEPTVETSSETPAEHNLSMMPGALSASEAAPYKFNLPLEERIKLAEELAMKMPRDGMEQMRVMFPDLDLSLELRDNDPKNLMKMGPETWYYSPSADITIAVCTDTNGPIHVFNGKNPSENDVKEASRIMHSMMEGGEAMMDNSDGYEAQYIIYTDSLYQSLIGKRAFAIFFHADWCPVCVQLEKEIMTDLSSFSEGTVILKANFDQENELKKQYDILSQSTFVIIDKNGKANQTLSAPSIENLKKAISQTL